MSLNTPGQRFRDAVASEHPLQVVGAMTFEGAVGQLLAPRAVGEEPRIAIILKRRPCRVAVGPLGRLQQKAGLAKVMIAARGRRGAGFYPYLPLLDRRRFGHHAAVLAIGCGALQTRKNRLIVAQHQQDAPDDQLEIWMTLFDLYRATGQHDRFDTLAIDFAAQYSRSAPLWFSMPEQLGMAPPAAAAAPGAAAAAPAGAVRRDFSWNAPPTLAVSSVAALQASLARAASPWTLSWARLGAIDDAAVPLLADQFTQWAERDVQLVFSGVEKLNALLDAKTQSGDRATSPEWWRLRMAALRLMGKPDEFELVALDYCVTYEVSPPSWASPRCGYSDNEGVSSGSAPLAADSDFMASDLGELSAPAPLEAGPVAQLSGYIDGDATPLLEPFQAFLRPGVPLTIACDKLIRVDFAAAGSVLNWAAEQQGHGHVIQFQNLQRLVAIFFNVIGINEHAWVVPRKN